MHSWSWSYTILAALLLLVVFAVCGAVLLLRSSPLRRWHRGPESISTPYGDISYSDIETQHMLAQGIERARTRQYYNPRGER